MFIFDLLNGKKPVTEGTDVERKIHRTQALIQDYYKRSRETRNDIKRDHYIDMARQLEYELDGLINDANQAEQDSYSAAQHDAEPSATWNRGGLAEAGDTPKGQEKLARVHNRAANRVTSKKADSDPAYARKAQQTQNRAWERLAVKEEGVAEGQISTIAIEYKIKADDGKYHQRHVVCDKKDLEAKLNQLRNKSNIKDIKVVEQGVAEGSLNEVDPRNYDSDVDYYNAVRKSSRSPQSYDDEPPMPADPYDPEGEMLQRQAARAAKKMKPVINYDKTEGTAPNGQRYNTVMTIDAPDTMSADHEVRSFNDHNWGAKKIVDTVKNGSNYTVYIVDNHRYGMWTPFKDQPAELEEGRKGFDMQLVQVLKKNGFKGPVRLGQLKAWEQELSDILDSDDMIMIAGNDPTFDEYVGFDALIGRYISGGEGMYHIPTVKQLIKSHSMREGKTLEKIADREHSLKRDRFRSLGKDNLREGEVDYSIGDDVVITGPVQYKGATGMVDSFGQDKRFVVVDLYNYGKHSFHTSDVSFNDYADSDDEEADMYDKDEDFRNWSNSGYDFK